MAETSGPCGPFFVEELRVVDEAYTDEPSIWYSSKQETTFAKLPSYLAQIARMGVLSRKLEAISFYWHGEFRDRWNIEAREWARPDWAPYYGTWTP